ncbi:trehalase-like domain-containing protein [Kribbella sp. NPDC050820]|uniref:trehalase-like domain-containing protein n=1 Tax=Kribbella sp. NPDC050820 TaxID=3155408 RepID=UPI0033C8AEB5
MTAHIEDYALIGDLRTAALIGVDGSIDWLALPRFDSPAIHAALLGTAEHGHWALAPVTGRHCARRSYRSGTSILETDWITEAGAVRVTDFMDPTSPASQVIRLVEGLMGEVAMATTLRPRVSFTLTHTTGGDAPLPDPTGQLASTDAFWTDWSGRSTYTGRWAGEVTQSLVFLKALTYAPTGGILAAATTSLPEQTLDWLPGHAVRHRSESATPPQSSNRTTCGVRFSTYCWQRTMPTYRSCRRSVGW